MNFFRINFKISNTFNYVCLLVLTLAVFSVSGVSDITGTLVISGCVGTGGVLVALGGSGQTLVDVLAIVLGTGSFEAGLTGTGVGQLGVGTGGMAIAVVRAKGTFVDSYVCWYVSCVSGVCKILVRRV